MLRAQNDTFNKGPKAGANSANCDLYREIFNVIYDKMLRVHVRWMPSHKGEGDSLPEGVSNFDVYANDRADTFAKEAAKSWQLPLAVSINFLHYASLVGNIQRRLATIMVNLPSRERCGSVCKEPAEPKESVEDWLATTTHSITWTGNRFH